MNKEINLNICCNCMQRLKDGDTVCPHCGCARTNIVNPQNVLPSGTILAGKYYVGRMIGQGGFGVTYLGFDLVLDLRVAIKEFFPGSYCYRNSVDFSVVSSSSDQQGLFRNGKDSFLQEAKTLATVNSINVVRVRDYFNEHGTAYIVMDYVDGKTLKQEIKACGGRIPYERVLNLMDPLIKELGKLHDKQIIHRDIKPDNLILVKEANEERLVLLDFGAARSFIADESKTYSTVLTPGYAPIEQYQTHGKQGPYTDIYALCATMYYALTGTVPPPSVDRVPGGDNEELKAPSAMGVMLPLQAEKAILKGLEYQNAKRFQTMEELREALVSKYSENPEKIRKGADNDTASAETVTTYDDSTENRKTVLIQDDSNTAVVDSGSSRNKKIWLVPLAILMVLLVYLAVHFVFKSDSNPEESPEPVQITPMPADSPTVPPTPTQTTKVPTMSSKPVMSVVSQKPTSEEVHTTSPELPTDTETPTQAPTTISETEVPTQSSVSSETTELSVGDVISFGVFEQNNNATDGVEPVQWIVLSVEKDRALIMSSYGLTNRPFDKNKKTDWSKSALHDWLNLNFYNQAFSVQERNEILEISEAGKIFVFSQEEFDTYLTSDNWRVCKPTESAKKTGTNTNASGNCWYWLRSVGENARNISAVNADGAVSTGLSSTSTDTAVRPALWIRLK